jgi:uncharacterized membrane protein YphA (DoxX/SURF4 family)
MWNKVAIFVIAISQFVLSLVWLGVAMAGGLSPSLVVYGVWGLVSACVLPFSGVVTRAVALVWHLIFVGYVLANSRPPNNETDKIITVWAVLDLAATFYLAKITLHSYRNRPKSEP